MWQHIKATCFNLFTVGEWRKYDFFYFFLFPPAAPGRRQTWVSPAVGSTPAQLESPGCLCNTPVIIVAINSFISQVIKCSWRAQQEVFFFSPTAVKCPVFSVQDFFCWFDHLARGGVSPSSAVLIDVWNQTLRVVKSEGVSITLPGQVCKCCESSETLCPYLDSASETTCIPAPLDWWVLNVAFVFD